MIKAQTKAEKATVKWRDETGIKKNANMKEVLLQKVKRLCSFKPASIYL